MYEPDTKSLKHLEALQAFMDEVGQGGCTMRGFAHHLGLKVTPYLRRIVWDACDIYGWDRLRVPHGETMVKDVFYPGGTLQPLWRDGDAAEGTNDEDTSLRAGVEELPF